MGPYLADPVEGGGGCKDISSFLHRGCPVYASIWVVDMVHDPLHGANPGGGSTTGWLDVS